MGTETTATNSSEGQLAGLFAEMLQARIYKPMLGRVARQITFAAIWLAFGIGAWRWFDTGYGFTTLSGDESDNSLANTLRYLLPALTIGIGFWFGFRLVNYPKFADFLIAVEAEMNKVSWPSQDELIRSSLVVILLLASLTSLLFVFDTFWYAVFVWVGIR
jgi:preprotein translocase subunit SecE